MFLAVTKSLVVRFPDFELHLSPGRVWELDEDRALRLLARGKDRVRLLTIGSWIAFERRLFGRCTGQVAMLPERGWLVVRAHEVTGNLALIPVEAIVGILTDAEIDQVRSCEGM